MAENGAFSRAKKAPFSVLGAGVSKHKSPIWLLLCRPTFLAPREQEKWRAPFSGEDLFRRDAPWPCTPRRYASPDSHPPGGRLLKTDEISRILRFLLSQNEANLMPPTQQLGR